MLDQGLMCGARWADLGPSGRSVGTDVTNEMLALTRSNAAAAGVQNVEFRNGYLEEMPLAGGSVDVVISNYVINVSGDEPAVIRETGGCCVRAGDLQSPT